MKPQLDHTRHGEAKRSKRSRLYTEWQNMRSRCRLPKSNQGHESYKHVTCHAAWARFEDFRDWALAKGYHDSLTLDRITNSLGYFPDNCQWRSMKAQVENRDWTRIKKRCLCVDTGEQFASIADALRKYEVSTRNSNLTRAIKQGYKWKGKRWTYI